MSKPKTNHAHESDPASEDSSEAEPVACDRIVLFHEAIAEIGKAIKTLVDAGTMGAPQAAEVALRVWAETR